MTRYAPRRVLVVLFGLNSAAFMLEWVAIGFVPSSAAVAVYVHVAVFCPVILSAFWSLINEQFDPHTARAAVSRVATGAALGGVIGGIAAWRASALVTLPTTVLLLACVSGLCLLGTVAIPRGVALAPSPSHAVPKESALRVLVGTRYLISLAMLVGVGAAISSLLDYVFSAQATLAYGSGAPLLAFFSLFSVAVSLLSLGVQLSLGRIALERLGIGVNIAVLPGILVLGSTAALAVPGLVTASLLRGAEMVQRNTLFRSAYELLYTPVEEQQKRSTKALIDVGFDRMGTVLGSGMALGASLLFVQNQSAMLIAVVALAATTLPLSRNLHRGYVAALKQRLREGDTSSASRKPRPSFGFQEKAQDDLIENIEGVEPHPAELGIAAQARRHRRELVQAVDDLLSSHTERRRAALASWDKSKLPLVPFAILLLADDEVHVDARKALRAVAKEATGQLLDALFDPAQDFVIRRRIPAVLAACANQQAADGLVLVVQTEERFEIRYACVRALAKVAERGRDVVFVNEKIIDTIQGEIKRITTTFSELDDGSDDDPGALVHLIARDRVSRSVESLFSLLSLILERDGLRLCFIGLHDDDERQRGAALEYLQTVLPTELRDALLPLLTEAGPIPTMNTPADLLTELGQVRTRA
jgi:hypothetical protein